MFEDELINNFIKESDIKKSFDIYFKIPKVIKDKDIRVFRIIPSFKGLSYDIQITYVDDTTIKINKDPNKIMAIDLGVNNLATCVLSNNESFIIDGKYLKSINHFYNKQKASLQGKKQNQKEYTLMEYRVTEKRNSKANKIIVVDKGEIIEMGSPEELMALKGKYYKLIQIQTMSDQIRKTKEEERFD